MKIAFAGTPEFAAAALAALYDAPQADEFEIVTVLTQPDRPAGRGMRLQMSAVKQLAMSHSTPVLQPRSLRLDGKYPDEAKSMQAALLAAQPDVMIVAAYGLILPEWVLTLPRLGCLNIHASLLPRWRGAAPIHRAIEAGDTETGITLMQMDAGLDTGDMLLTAHQPITPTDTTASLHDKLAAQGASLLLEGLRRLAAGKLTRTPQPSEGVSYAHKIAKSEAAMDFTQTAQHIANKLRAYDPFPGATGVLGDEVIKLWKAEVVEATGKPAEVLSADAKGVVIACGEGAIKVTELQRAGGKRVAAQAFLAGFPINAGDTFQVGPS